MIRRSHSQRRDRQRCVTNDELLGLQAGVAFSPSIPSKRRGAKPESQGERTAHIVCGLSTGSRAQEVEMNDLRDLFWQRGYSAPDALTLAVRCGATGELVGFVKLQEAMALRDT